MNAHKFLGAWREFSVAEPVTLMLSGGGDSVALFHLLLEAAVAFGCLHFSHDGDPDFSAQSRDFCRSLCQRHGVPLEIQEIRGKALMGRGDLSWEAACRTLRYAAVKDRPGTFLTAHTIDDQAETVMLKLLDGSGLSGLSGVARRRADGVIRPLLAFSRCQLRDYLRERGVEWLDDPSNQDGNERARVRHQVLPYLQQQWPHLTRTLARTAARLGEDETYLVGQAHDWLRRHTAPEGDNWALADFRGLARPVAFRVLKTIGKAFSRQGFRPRASLFGECFRLLSRGGNDTWVEFPGGWALGVLGERVWARPSLEDTSWQCAPPHWHHPPAFLKLSHSPNEGAEAWRVPPGATLRSRLPGDRYRGKSVKKTLAAGKQPPWVRDRVPLLVREGEVLAVWGVPGRESYQEGTTLWVEFDAGLLRGSVLPAL